jgi:hypothetical protein
MSPPILAFVLVLAGNGVAWALTKRGHRAVGALALLAVVAGLVIAGLTEWRSQPVWVIGAVVGVAISHAFLWRTRSRPDPP